MDSYKLELINHILEIGDGERTRAELEQGTTTDLEKYIDLYE